MCTLLCACRAPRVHARTHSLPAVGSCSRSLLLPAACPLPTNRHTRGLAASGSCLGLQQMAKPTPHNPRGAPPICLVAEMRPCGFSRFDAVPELGLVCNLLLRLFERFEVRQEATVERRDGALHLDGLEVLVQLVHERNARRDLQAGDLLVGDVVEVLQDPAD
eukprot:scaffold3431_cov128-Isochrysis_galbana.AAC.2